jgi:hypothetical protein
VANLPETLADVADEATARQIVEDLNARIADSHRRQVDGPPLVIALVDVESALDRWRADRRSR